MHTATQKTVSVSSKQSTQSVMADRVQGQITDGAKIEYMTSAGKKELMNQKTKDWDKSEAEMLKSSQKISAQTVNPDTALTTVQSVNFNKVQTENKTIKDKTVVELAAQREEKAPKSQQHENKKKSDHSLTKSPEKVSNQPVQTDKPVNGNGKNGKQNHKAKKNNKQEKQVDIKVSSENEKQGICVDLKEEVKEATEVKVISEVKTESKQEVKKVSPSRSANGASVSSTSESQTPAKKKKKNKKSKGVVQSGQGKEICIESKMEVIENKKSTSETQIQETISVAQVHTSVKQEQIHIKKEVFTQESKDNQNSHELKVVQKDVKGSVTKKEVSVSQEPPEDSRVVPITVTGKSEQSELFKSATGRSDGSQRQQVQLLISHIMDLQRVSEKSDWKSVKTLLNTVPDWLISPETKCELEQTVAKSDAQKNEEILSHLMKVAESKLMDLEDNETMEKHECEAVSEKAVAGGASPRISKISIGSAKVEYQTKKTTTQERRKEEVSYVKSMDLRAPSPLLKMRSPSPSFITIESTRRTDSPQRVTPSITPSPTFDRAENLARLKDTTAKLSRGVTPPPILSQQQISEKKSEIVESPPSFHRQIKIDTQVVEDKEKTKKKVDELSSASVREKREFFEEAQKAGINKTYVRKEPIAIPERLGPDMEECVAESKNKEKDEIPRADLSSLVNKFESAEEKTYIRKELIPPAGRLHNSSESTECDKEKADILEQEMPTFDIQAIKNVFELGEQSSLFTDEKKDEEELVSSLTETTKNEVESVPAEPAAISQAKSITEHFSNVDEFGNKVTGTRTTVTEHSESTQRVPFSYADAVKRKAARRTETYDEEATENLLRNFHKTWTESETVFKSLGYTVSEETSQVMSHHTEIGSSGKEPQACNTRNVLFSLKSTEDKILKG
uniref:Uncharacterized protein n=1 Tax=Sphaeramia orbicularis TaxID=375764 RepID=A0A673CXW0_9TELE